MINLEMLLQRATELFHGGSIEEAGRMFEVALERNPNQAYALFSLGTIFSIQGRNGIAMPLLQRAIEERPKFPEAMSNLAICLRREGHDEAANEVYKIATDIDPGNAESWSNWAGANINMGRPERAIELADKALAINPRETNALYHKGLALLENGQLEEGWKLYQHRFSIKEWSPRNYPFPKWDGKRVDRLLVHGEQGIGDEILFMSWMPVLKQMAGEVFIECTPRLVPILEKSLGVKCFGTEEEVMTSGYDFSAVVPMGSVPVYCGEKPPAHEGYLYTDPERVKHYRARLEELGPGPYLGISWFGGLKGTHWHLRNAQPEYWDRVRLPTTISVQYGEMGGMAEKMGLPHWQDAIDDIGELLALLKALDLVVTVNNSTVHMCGGLNVPCWTLTPSRPAWRYGVRGDGMPWYPSVRQIRQTGLEWGPVFERVEKELADFAGIQKAQRAAA